MKEKKLYYFYAAIDKETLQAFFDNHTEARERMRETPEESERVARSAGLLTGRTMWLVQDRVVLWSIPWEEKKEE